MVVGETHHGRKPPKFSKNSIPSPKFQFQDDGGEDVVKSLCADALETLQLMWRSVPAPLTVPESKKEQDKLKVPDLDGWFLNMFYCIFIPGSLGRMNPFWLIFFEVGWFNHQPGLMVSNLFFQVSWSPFLSLDDHDLEKSPLVWGFVFHVQNILYASLKLLEYTRLVCSKFYWSCSTDKPPCLQSLCFVNLLNYFLKFSIIKKQITCYLKVIGFPSLIHLFRMSIYVSLFVRSLPQVAGVFARWQTNQHEFPAVSPQRPKRRAMRLGSEA